MLFSAPVALKLKNLWFITTDRFFSFLVLNNTIDWILIGLGIVTVDEAHQ